MALRTIRIIEEEGFAQQAAEKGDYLLNGLQQTLGDHPHVGEVRGKGLMCGVEFVKDRGTKEEFAASDNVGSRLNAETQKRGLFARLRGDVYCLAPPVVTTREQLDQIVDALAGATDAVLG